jgi:predicted SAM-dependent methyltransferase
MKLNLGSNTIRYNGFLNVDIRDVPYSVDIVDDVSVLNGIPDGSVDEIKSEAILEHFAPDRTLDVIKVWVRKLEKGGKILIMVPDGELIFNRYLQDGKWDKLVHSMFGNMELMREWHGKEAELYMHHTLFSKQSLWKQMEQAGLKDIKEAPARHGDCFALEGIK